MSATLREYRRVICLIEGQNSPEHLNKYVIDTIRLLDTNVKKIIDVGCGNGFQANLLKKAFPDVVLVGVDFSETSIKYLQSLENKIFDEVILANSEKLPIQDNYGDISLCMENLEHLYYEEVINALTELKRVATYIIITIPTPLDVINKGWLEKEMQEALNDTIPLTQHDYRCLESCVHKSCIKTHSFFNAGFKQVYKTDGSNCYYVKSSDLDVSKIEVYGIKKAELPDTTDYKNKYLTLLYKSYTLTP